MIIRILCSFVAQFVRAMMKRVTQAIPFHSSMFCRSGFQQRCRHGWGRRRHGCHYWHRGGRGCVPHHHNCCRLLLRLSADGTAERGENEATTAQRLYNRYSILELSKSHVVSGGDFVICNGWGQSLIRLFPCHLIIAIYKIWMTR